MTRIKFTEQLSDLNNEMIQMGSLCESAIDICVDALLNGDVALAKVVSQREREIDEKESEITALCMKMLVHEYAYASAACGKRPAPDQRGTEDGHRSREDRRSG